MHEKPQVSLAPTFPPVCHTRQCLACITAILPHDFTNRRGRPQSSRAWVLLLTAAARAHSGFRKMRARTPLSEHSHRTTSFEVDVCGSIHLHLRRPKMEIQHCDLLMIYDKYSDIVTMTIFQFQFECFTFHRSISTPTIDPQYSRWPSYPKARAYMRRLLSICDPIEVLNPKAKPLHIADPKVSGHAPRTPRELAIEVAREPIGAPGGRERLRIAGDEHSLLWR